MTMNEIQTLPVLVDVKTSANVLGCSGRFVRALCESGKLKAVKLGSHWRVNTASLLAYAGLVAEP